MKYFSLICFLIIAPLLAFANIILPETVEGSVNWLEVISQIIANPKAVTPVTIGALVILGIVQILKHETLGKFFKNLKPKIQFMIVTLLGVIYAILAKLTIADESVPAVVIAVLSAGGAVAIFNALKLFFEKD